jgi:hypothetical protein
VRTGSPPTALSAFWPLPNVPNAPSNDVNYTAFQTPGISNYHIDTRFDARITANDNIFVTWSKSTGYSTLTGGIPPTELHNFPVQDQAFLVTANYARIFTPNLTNELIFGVGDGALVTIQPSLLKLVQQRQQSDQSGFPEYGRQHDAWDPWCVRRQLRGCGRQ